MGKNTLLIGGWKCRENCGECCGPVPMLREFIVKHNAELQEKPDILMPYPDEHGRDVVVAFTASGNCVFLKGDKRCAVYQERPRVCKMYGYIPQLPCIYFYPDGRPREPENQRKIREFYGKRLQSVLGSKRFEQFRGDS